MKSTHAQREAQPAHEPARPRGAAGRLQRKAADGGAQVEAPPIVGQVLGSAGSALEPSTRQQMETRFGHDFGRVRVHADARAAESAEAVDAHAYTVGDHVVFGPGRYAPHTQAGRLLLAHELTHTLQQRDAAPSLQPRLEVSRPGDPAEAEADRAASLAAGPSRPAAPVAVNAAPHAPLMRQKKGDPPKALGPHEAAAPLPEELKVGFGINDAHTKTNEGQGLIPKIQYFLKIDLAIPRIASYLTGKGTHRISEDEGKKIRENPAAKDDQKKDLILNPGESWNKIITDLTLAVAKWQAGWNARPANAAAQIPVNGGLDAETVKAMRQDGMTEDAQVWAKRDEQERLDVREDEHRFWRKRGEASGDVRDKIVGLAMSQIGKVSQQDRGDMKKFGWERILRYYEVAYGAADEERKRQWLKENFTFQELYDPVTEEQEDRVWAAGAEGLGASAHVGGPQLGRGEPRPRVVGPLSQAAQKEVAEDSADTTPEAVWKQLPHDEKAQMPPKERLKSYDKLKQEQSSWYTRTFGENLSQSARQARGEKPTSAYLKTQEAGNVFSFSKVQNAKDAGPWSWCAIFTMWAVKSVTGRGLWAAAPVGLKSTTVGKASDFKGARRGDILAIRSSNSHHVLLAKDPSPDPTDDELLEAVEGNIEIQGVRHSKRWRVKNVAKYFSAVE